MVMLSGGVGIEYAQIEVDLLKVADALYVGFSHVLFGSRTTIGNVILLPTWVAVSATLAVISVVPSPEIVSAV